MTPAPGTATPQGSVAVADVQVTTDVDTSATSPADRYDCARACLTVCQKSSSRGTGTGLVQILGRAETEAGYPGGVR